MTNHQHAKALYCQGQSVTDIANALSVSRTAVYGYKKKDKGLGVDWDSLRFIKATDTTDAQRNEQDFVALLIFNFEQALDKVNRLEPDAQLKELTKYASTYYKLKMQRENPKVNKADLAKDVLHQLSQIALHQQADCVIEFLATHADAIVSAVIE